MILANTTIAARSWRLVATAGAAAGLLCGNVLLDDWPSPRVPTRCQDAAGMRLFTWGDIEYRLWLLVQDKGLGLGTQGPSHSLEHR
jgi:hypothetical protein